MKIICIAKNYIAHAKELNSDVPEKPVFFMKPESALVTKNKPFFYPDFSNEIHYETEIVLNICRLGRHIEQRFAHRYYDKIALGIDFTARDIQRDCVKKGLPWEAAKAFDYSAPVSKFIPKANFDDIFNIDFSLKINDNEVQKGNTNDMIFNFDVLISHISKFVTLKMGDLIFTGTPVGVGPVKIGDHLEGFIGNEKMLDFYIK